MTVPSQITAALNAVDQDAQTLAADQATLTAAQAALTVAQANLAAAQAAVTADQQHQATDLDSLITLLNQTYGPNPAPVS